MGTVENVRSLGVGGGGVDWGGDGDAERRALWLRCWRAKISWMCKAWV